MTTQYTAIVQQERGWYAVHCVEIPGLTARGPTLEAAKASLAEAIVLVLGEREGERGEQPWDGELH